MKRYIRSRYEPRIPTAYDLEDPTLRQKYLDDGIIDEDGNLLVDDTEDYDLDEYGFEDKEGIYMEGEIKCSVENYPEGLVVQTLQEAYEMDNTSMGDIWDDIEEYAEGMFGLPASSIKRIYGLYDGYIEDSGIETTDGGFYIAYSGHGTEPVPSKEAMLKHFTYDVD